MLEAIASLPGDDNSDDAGDDAGNQLSLDNFVKPADWPEGKPLGTLTIDALIASGTVLSSLTTHWWRKRLVISELHRQRTMLLSSKTRSIPDRIVNLVQRQVRPMVLGKVRAAVEFGALPRRASAHGKSEFLCAMAMPSCIGSAGIHTMRPRIQRSALLTSSS